MYRLVFVIDDSPIDRTLSGLLIRKNSFAAEIISFGSGSEALTYLNENRANPELLPEVIFLDIHMPAMSGFDFLDKYIEQFGNITEKPAVVMVSSTTSTEDHERVKTYPSLVRRFVPKPLTAAALIEMSTGL